MKENTYILEDAIEALLGEKNYSTLRDILITMNPADIAALFEELPVEWLPVLFRLLPKELAAEAFVEMNSEEQEMLIKGFSDAELKEVVDELYVDDAVDIVEEMPANVVKRILRQADSDKRRMINDILKYPEDSAGSIMTTEFVSLRPKMTTREAIKRIRRTGIDKETIYTCYVTQESNVLIGYISIRALILADEEDVIENIMERNVISVRTTDDQEEVARALSKYGFLAVPVVDMENRLVGIVTVDDALDVIEEETTEDISKMAAITPSDIPYMRMGVIEIWKHRIPWLMLLMISATFTGMIITSFESALAAQVMLTAFIPMLMDTGGNSGSQASATIIRSISLGDVEFSDIFSVIWKESRVALLCGVSLAAANLIKIILVDIMLLGNNEITISVAAVVCITLALTVLIAKVVGCALPILAERLGFDPAVMASPFITTIVDAISLLIYFQVAMLLLEI